MDSLKHLTSFWCMHICKVVKSVFLLLLLPLPLPQSIHPTRPDNNFLRWHSKIFSPPFLFFSPLAIYGCRIIPFLPTAATYLDRLHGKEWKTSTVISILWRKSFRLFFGISSSLLFRREKIPDSLVSSVSKKLGKKDDNQLNVFIGIYI